MLAVIHATHDLEGNEIIDLTDYRMGTPVRTWSRRDCFRVRRGAFEVVEYSRASNEAERKSRVLDYMQNYSEKYNLSGALYAVSAEVPDFNHSRGARTHNIWVRQSMTMVDAIKAVLTDEWQDTIRVHELRCDLLGVSPSAGLGQTTTVLFNLESSGHAKMGFSSHHTREWKRGRRS